MKGPEFLTFPTQDKYKERLPDKWAIYITNIKNEGKTTPHANTDSKRSFPNLLSAHKIPTKVFLCSKSP